MYVIFTEPAEYIIVTAWQSSTAYGGNALRAVDGDTSTSWYDESCTHTTERFTN